MTRRLRLRFLVILGVTGLSIYLIVAFGIRLGLDLQGGAQVGLEVLTDDAIRSQTDQAIAHIQTYLEEQNIRFRAPTRTHINQFTVTGVDPLAHTELSRMFTQTYPDWDAGSTTSETDNTYVVTLKPIQERAFRQQAVDQAINTIRNRIDQMGINEAVIQKRGGSDGNEIIVQFPGVSDPGRVKDVIHATALLEFKMVDGLSGYPTREAAMRQYGGAPPLNLEILPSAEKTADQNPTFYAVQRIAPVGGRDLKSAYASRDENGYPAVTFNLTSSGSERFGRLTEENIGKLLAIVLDGRIQSVARINNRISQSGIIVGGAKGFALQEAQDLALVLRSGALPASMRTLGENLVGASLGADSIRKGIVSSIVALAGVITFMLLYYRGAGANAAIAMLLNLIILFGAMAYLGATLTLPGFAGVILTVGLGIDSNVLIFERIREELRAGQGAAAAVGLGFSRVFVTLVDTHLSALISATFLFLFGTGPVKGFAVTLVIGLVSNMFTSVFVSRTFFDWLLIRQQSRAVRLSI